MKKLIIFDCGFLTHQSIYAWANQFKLKTDDSFILPASYSYLNTVYSVLKKIGIDKDDKVLFAKDGRNSWRRAFYLPYKAQRQAGRESHEEIDWDKQYADINGLEDRLQESTNWNVIQFNKQVNYADLCLTKQGVDLNIEGYDLDYSIEYGFEADDIMALAPKVFPDHEVILVATDQDLHQLYYFENLKIFNPKLKSATNKAKKGFYVVENDPLKIISKKVRTGDVSDNILVDKKKDTVREVEIRRFIIDMISMPGWLTTPIIEGLKNLEWGNTICYEELPFQNSLAKNFDKIYETKNIRTHEESLVRYYLKEMKTIEKRSKKTVEQLYEKNANYKKFKDEYDKHKTKKKTKVKV